MIISIFVYLSHHECELYISQFSTTSLHVQVQFSTTNMFPCPTCVFARKSHYHRVLVLDCTRTPLCIHFDDAIVDVVNPNKINELEKGDVNRNEHN